MQGFDVIWKCFLLGTVQGLTEFLPVSSSGHLLLLERVLGFSVGGSETFLNVMLHLGTLFSVVFAFRRDLFSLFKRPFRPLFLLLLATVPAGLTVFSGMTGGIGKLAGPTGGYLVGFIFTVILCGLFVEKGNGRWYVSFIGMILGTAVLYAFGTAWFCISTGTVLLPALELCVFPFLIGDFIKMALAVLTGPRLAARIKGAAA